MSLSVIETETLKGKLPMKSKHFISFEIKLHFLSTAKGSFLCCTSERSFYNYHKKFYLFNVSFVLCGTATSKEKKNETSPWSSQYIVQTKRNCCGFLDFAGN